MTPFHLSHRSLNSLVGAHPDIVRLVAHAIRISKVDFIVLETVRSVERQSKLVAKGASETMRSRHLTGHAVDLAAYVDGEISWDWSYYYEIAKAMKQAAKAQGVDIVWGGDWKSLRDGLHFQLSWKNYP